MSNLRKSIGTAVRQAAIVLPPVRRMVQAGAPIWGKTSQFLDLYSHDAPSPAVAFNIFKNEWSSAVPGFETGKSPLFDDFRIKWLETQLGSFENKRVLELGPLEGGQTYMMERAGANVLAIEANQRAFLKCLVVKNALKLKAEFLYGDFRPYLQTVEPGSFDFVTAIGVLYHMAEPVKLLHNIARVSNVFGVWTHYYDRDIIGEKKLRFDPKPQIQVVDGKSVDAYRQHYLASVAAPGFCGGSAPTSFWLTKSGLLQFVESLGFEITVGDENLNHPNGPCILFFAKRRR